MDLISNFLSKSLQALLNAIFPMFTNSLSFILMHSINVTGISNRKIDIFIGNAQQL